MARIDFLESASKSHTVYDAIRELWVPTISETVVLTKDQASELHGYIEHLEQHELELSERVSELEGHWEEVFELRDEVDGLEETVLGMRDDADATKQGVIRTFVTPNGVTNMATVWTEEAESQAQER